MKLAPSCQLAENVGLLPNCSDDLYLLLEGLKKSA